MKKALFLPMMFLGNLILFAQDNKSDDLTGLYQIDFYPSRKLKVEKENNEYTLEIVGQGKTRLKPMTNTGFSVTGIPNSTIEFIKDSLGKTTKFVWKHDPFQSVWERGSGDTPDTSTKSFGIYAGKYSRKGNGWIVLQISAQDDRLISQIPGEIPVNYFPTGKNTFIFKSGDYNNTYEFLTDKKGKITRFKNTESGPFVCSKVFHSTGDVSIAKHNFNKRSEFTEADSLQGTLSLLRTCYDVVFYDLDLTVNPDEGSIHGSGEIRFRAVNDFSELQVDLFANMKIEKILYNNNSLKFSRKYDAVFIRLPKEIKKDSIGEIEIFYSGKPVLPDVSELTGGFIWSQDKNGKPWIEVVSQGIGASMWWPCKDHLSDKPDSMHINITVPTGLNVISNGQFIGKTELQNKQTRYQWAVHYPMNTYDAVLYIGDYIHFSDEYSQGGVQFPLNYYCLSYNAGIAKKFVSRVKPMFSLYEKDFGPYPFPIDGYALVESPYGMEHQSAVSIGTFTNPSDQSPVDSVELQRMLWHESAHEWWGNSVTCSDYADFWIHESFASYSEVLSYQQFYGDSIADKYLLDQQVDNKQPIIGFYGVNDFHEGDMYTKGSRMISTLRNTINNDSLFFAVLKSIQSTFKYQSVNTSDLVGLVNKIAGADYTYLFDQYLRYAPIPKLMITMKKSGNDMILQFKWNANVSNFALPVKITDRQKEFFIYPTTEWKSIALANTLPGDIKIDNVRSYFEIEKSGN